MLKEWTEERLAKILSTTDMYYYLDETSQVSGAITKAKLALGLSRRATMSVVAKQMFEDFCDRQGEPSSTWTLEEAAFRSCKQIAECGS